MESLRSRLSAGRHPVDARPHRLSFALPSRGRVTAMPTATRWFMAHAHTARSRCATAVGCMVVGFFRSCARALVQIDGTSAAGCPTYQEGIERRLGGSVSGRRCSRSSTTSTRCSPTATRALARATARAGDLAHGLKTPLAVLSERGRAARGERAIRPSRRRSPSRWRWMRQPGRLPPRPRPRRGVGDRARHPGGPVAACRSKG